MKKPSIMAESMDKIFTEIFPKLILDEQVSIVIVLCTGANKDNIRHPLVQKWIDDNAANMAQAVRDLI